MGSESGIRVLLFVHLAVMALVARQATAHVQTKELRVALVRHSIVFWLISVLAVVVSMAVAAILFAVIYAQRTMYLSSTLMWGIVFGVAGIVVLGSAFVLHQRLKKQIRDSAEAVPKEQA